MKNNFWLASRKWRRSLREIIEISRNKDYKTSNLLDFACFKEHYKLIAIDLSKQTKLKDPQQIVFIGKPENQPHEASMFFLIEKSEEITLELFQNFVNIL